MPKRHGRNARLYVAVTSGGSAEPLLNITGGSLAATTDKVDVTSLGDTSKTYVAGLPDGQGDFAGFWDDTTPGTYTAASDGVARKFYLYEDTLNAPTKYFFGTAFFDFKVEFAVADAVKVSGSYSAATPIGAN